MLHNIPESSMVIDVHSFLLSILYFILQYEDHTEVLLAFNLLSVGNQGYSFYAR